MDDEIRAELSGRDLDDVEEIENPLLEEVLEFYNCHDLLGKAQRIMWLHSIKESLGQIPSEFEIVYDEMRYLVVLNEELSKKTAHDSWRMKQEAQKVKSQI